MALLPSVLLSRFTPDVPPGRSAPTMPGPGLRLHFGMQNLTAVWRPGSWLSLQEAKTMTTAFRNIVYGCTFDVSRGRAGAEHARLEL